MPFSTDIHISPEEKKQMRAFENLREEMFSLPEERLKDKLHKLNILRLSSSQTHNSQDHEAIARWNRAQNHIYHHCDALFDFDFIMSTNEILTENSSVLRDQEIFAGGASFLSNDEKDRELEHFKKVVLPLLKNHHPLVGSTALRYWIVSLHPFKDGNGRTSQSLGDAWLVINQFPPLFFKNPHEGAFAYIPHYREEFSFNHALQSSFVGLNNAFNFILNKA